MRYLRGRRPTEAARALARGTPDILALALNAPDFESRIGQCSEEFGGRTGLGGLEIWMPVKA